MYEIIIIGGGLVGCLSALRLSDAGYSCLIIDGDDLSRSASMRSAGGIYLQLQSQIALQEGQLLSHAKNMIPLLQHTIPAWKRLQSRINKIPLYLNGGIIVATSESEKRILTEKNKFEQICGLNSVILDHKEIRSLSKDFSSEIICGTYVNEEGYCHPNQLMNLILKELQDKKVTIKKNARVIDLQTGNTIKVFLENKKKFEAEKVILAAGAYTGQFLEILKIKNPISPLPIQMFSMTPSEIEIPVLTRSVNQKLSVKKISSGEIWIGGGWPAMGPGQDWLEIKVSSLNIKKNLNNAVKVYPKIKDLKIKSKWGGYAAWTEDGLPILGPICENNNLLMAVGGNGFSLAPLYSEILTELVMEKQNTIDINHFLLSRFQSNRDNSLSLLPD